MFLLIDGYNVLHMCGFIRGGVGPGTLRRARGVLLGELSSKLDESNRKRTTVVFDAAEEIENRSSRQVIAEMVVEFATDHAQADDRIEQLIKQHSAPKQLTVVSSDRRLQQAARRRGARFVESQDWMDQLAAGRSKHDQRKSSGDKPSGDATLSGEEVQQWIQYLDDPGGEVFRQSKSEQPDNDESTKPPDNAFNPFPEGYGEDLLDESRGD